MDPAAKGYRDGSELEMGLATEQSRKGVSQVESPTPRRSLRTSMEVDGPLEEC